jgi:hypothetical protein
MYTDLALLYVPGHLERNVKCCWCAQADSSLLLVVRGLSQDALPVEQAYEIFKAKVGYLTTSNAVLVSLV